MVFLVLLYVFVSVPVSIFDTMVSGQQMGLNLTVKTRPRLNEQGGIASVQCGWQVLDGSTPQTARLVDRYHFIMALNISTGELIHTPILETEFQTISVVSKTSDNFELRISNLSCGYAGRYHCLVESSYPDTNYTTVWKRTAYLYVRAPISISKPTIIKNKAPAGSDTWVTKKDSNITLTCVGNTGCPYQSSLQWRIYRGSVAEIIFAYERRLVDKETIENPGAQTVRLESTFSYKTTYEDQNMIIVCYIVSPYDTTPITICETNGEQLCAKTPRIYVISPATRERITLKILGKQPVLAGTDLKLLCTVNAYPLPSISWEKVGDPELVLIGVQEEQKSVLTIANVTILQHNGTYRCYANNTIDDKTFSAFNDIDVNIVNKTEEEDDKENKEEPSYAIFLLLGALFLLALIAILIYVLLHMLASSAPAAPPEETPYFSYSMAF